MTTSMQTSATSAASLAFSPTSCEAQGWPSLTSPSQEHRAGPLLSCWMTAAADPASPPAQLGSWPSPSVSSFAYMPVLFTLIHTLLSEGLWRLNMRAAVLTHNLQWQPGEDGLDKDLLQVV